MDYTTTDTNTMTINANTASGTSCSYLTGCPHRLPCGYCMIMKTPCISSTSITWTNTSNTPITSILSSNSAVEVKA